jgi:hypothetical protein
VSLKSNNVYLLPDGRELIARCGPLGNVLLHDPLQGVAAAPVYLVSRTGQLLSWGKEPSWTAADLRETGRISQPEMTRLQLL